MNPWWQIASVFLLSTVKFVFGGIPMALGFGFSFFESVTITTLGGMVGVLFFVTMSNVIIAWYKRRSALYYFKNPTAPRKKKFTKTNRFIILVKNRFGLVGFSFIVPFIIPIPIGCFLAVRYFHDKQKIIQYLFVSLLFWSATSYFLYKPLIDAIRNWILD